MSSFLFAKFILPYPLFSLGRAILCQKPLWHNGFWLSYYRGPYVTQ